MRSFYKNFVLFASVFGCCDGNLRLVMKVRLVGDHNLLRHLG